RDVSQSVNEEIRQALEKQYSDLEELEFTQEEIRKALQLAILKGLKAERVTNAVMTPDSIALMVSYLISKFIPSAK
ncbi:class I SAM-dependent methyltransferase, partial [Acinetobacter baumannii]